MIIWDGPYVGKERRVGRIDRRHGRTIGWIIVLAFCLGYWLGRIT